ncbi:MAG: carboxy terminal-processing peptidase, partial [Luminiphilus sp.]|nr:carboxy terminal-processing peptidase [Luminiphilus sp.]
DDQESKALLIENKRRLAKGLATLNDLADAENDGQGIEGDNEPSTSSPEGPEKTTAENSGEDVLLMETGRILVDAITLRPNTSVAGRAR